jgi:hypothetical protein
MWCPGIEFPACFLRPGDDLYLDLFALSPWIFGGEDHLQRVGVHDEGVEVVADLLDVHVAVDEV